MSDHSAIEWTDATWNPVTGCSKVSPGCAHCYAETISLRFGWSKRPWTPENAVENVVLHPERLDQPLRWRKPRMVFVNSMSDLFHELIPEHFIQDIFEVMARCPQHTFQILTKRPERAREILVTREGEYPSFCELVSWAAGGSRGSRDWLPSNIWLGVSIENASYTWRADVLRQIPAAVRFISAEPLLGSLISGDGSSDTRKPLDLTGIDWLIVGGESGPNFRPVNLDHVRELRDACLAEQLRRDPNGLDHAGPAFFFKQVGGRTPKAGGRLLDGREWDETPT